MYAVIETGGKQYRVEVGTELEVELLDAEPGSSVHIERVLLVADGETAAIGRPVVTNASVAADIVRRDRGAKTISFKYRPKARRRVKKGHRQELTVLKISDIVLDGHSAAADVAEAEAAHKRERAKLEEAARRQAAADAELAAKLRAEKPVSPAPAAKVTARSTAGTAKSTAGTAKSTAGTAKSTAGTAKASSAKPAPKGSATSDAKTPIAKVGKTTTSKASAPKSPSRAAKADATSSAKRTTKKES